jgi:hypothetical protein
MERIVDMSFSSNRFAEYVLMFTLTLVLLISSTAAHGQKGGRGHPGLGSSGAPSATVDDGTLKQTAKAYVKVRGIVQRGQQALDSTRDDAQKQDIAEQVESRKLAAVKSEGLRPQQYNQVLQLARADGQLQQKFLSYVNRAKSGAE